MIFFKSFSSSLGEKEFSGSNFFRAGVFDGFVEDSYSKHDKIGTNPG